MDYLEHISRYLAKHENVYAQIIYNTIYDDDDDSYFVLLDESNDVIERLCELGNIEYGYSDQYIYCDNCGRYIYIDTYGLPNYHIFDGYALCADCIRDNDDLQADYMDSLINNASNANCILSADQLVEVDFMKLNTHSFAHGFYGSVDRPAEIYDRFKHDYKDIVFSITSINPFETQFDVYGRNSDTERNI